ncbi:lipocalin family protein [Aquimarina macrocephali]|uniref:lipocalin family protein n=1 Tax=Aquimarina macrocephali TaxID=666563 RepID=UPI003F668749
MKKLNLFILFITISFISCSKDDDASKEETPMNKDLIIGKWDVIAITDIPNDDCELLSTLEIKADGTYEEQTYGGFSGGANCTPDDLDKGTWKLSENILTLTLDELGNANSLTSNNTILELTETTLKYEFEYNEEGQTHKEAWTFTKMK